MRRRQGRRRPPRSPTGSTCSATSASWWSDCPQAGAELLEACDAENQAIRRASEARLGIDLSSVKPLQQELIEAYGDQIADDRTMYTLLRTGLEGPLVGGIRGQERYLPDNIYTAVENFQASEYIAGLLGEDVRDKFAELKLASADRCPRLLGTRIKRAEVQFHHEVTNQNLWSRF